MSTQATIDQKLRELVSQGAARKIHDVAIEDPTQGIVEPAGMSLEDEEEIEILLEMADPAGIGDEQAAIERLVSILGAAPVPA